MSKRRPITRADIEALIERAARGEPVEREAPEPEPEVQVTPPSAEWRAAMAGVVARWRGDER